MSLAQDQQSAMLQRIKRDIPNESTTQYNMIYQHAGVILGELVEAGFLDGYLTKLICKSRPWYNSIYSATFDLYMNDCEGDPMKLPVKNQALVILK